MNREDRIRRANILNAILITSVIASVLIFSTPEQKREAIHYGKETIRIAGVVLLSVIPYSRKIFNRPDSPQFTNLKKEYMKIKPFPEFISKETITVDRSGLLKDNSDARASFGEAFSTQKSFSEVLQYYSRELRKEGWECVDNRGDYGGGAVGFYFKRANDDLYQWIIVVSEKNINKNKWGEKKETITYSVSIDYR